MTLILTSHHRIHEQTEVICSSSPMVVMVLTDDNKTVMVSLYPMLYTRSELQNLTCQ